MWHARRIAVADRERRTLYPAAAAAPRRCAGLEEGGDAALENLTVDHLPPLTEQLQVLTFGEKFNQPVSALHLPVGLHTLVFSSAFDQPLHELQLPEGLQHFAIRPSARSLAEFDRPPSELPLLPAGLRVFEAPRWMLYRVFAAFDFPPRCVLHAT